MTPAARIDRIMSFTLLYFGPLGDLTGTQTEEVGILEAKNMVSGDTSGSTAQPSSENSIENTTTLTVHELFKYICSKYGEEARALLKSCAVAVNMEYLDDGTDQTGNNNLIRPGDEVAMIPPVSSG